MREQLTSIEDHFAFGQNWAEYAKKVTEEEIVEAERGLQRLLGQDRLDGLRFIDIGCGSGIHCLAALRLGASEVLAIDLDPDSVKTTEAMLLRNAPANTHWRVHEMSVLELDPDLHGTYDVVYSWGVLHHTGAMFEALERAAKVTAQHGQFVFALYRRVWADFFWRWEKRWYSKASPAAQRRARSLYVALFRLAYAATGRNFSSYVERYASNRGMHYYHDVHDWLGGYPYESILPHEVEHLMTTLGFSRVRSFVQRGRIFGRASGILGSGCDEYVYRKS